MNQFKKIALAVCTAVALAALALPFGSSGFSSAEASNVSPLTIDGATTVDPETAKDLFERGVRFVDVRKDADWEAGRIPGAYHLELKTVLNEQALSEVAGKNEELVIYCNGPSCMRSSEACAKAVGWGFTNIRYFREGFPAWRLAGYPVE
jgi:rhodanese-related sulfurtransferase